jgi:DNA-binding transcriptional LysR family regulator
LRHVHNSRSKDTILNNRASAVDLQHLRYAVSSADHGSFRRAAEVLLVRQSTLSRCIRQLEHSIGLTLFERSSGGVRVTPAGRDFLRTARSILEQMDSLVTSAHHTSRGEAGRLAIGFYTSLSVGNLRATLVDYQKRFSKVDVSMKESSRLRLVTLDAVALFIRFWLTSTPALPAARAKGAERYDRFVEALGRRLSSGSTILREVSIESNDAANAARVRDESGSP